MNLINFISNLSNSYIMNFTGRQSRLNLNLKVHLPAFPTEQVTAGEAEHVVRGVFLHAHRTYEVFGRSEVLQNTHGSNILLDREYMC